MFVRRANPTMRGVVGKHVTPNELPARSNCVARDRGILLRHRRRTRAVMVLLASCLAMLAIGANSTAIMAALPTMRTDFGLGEIGTQWTINAYLVVSAACIVLGGKAADRFGARLVSMVGLALFGVASCVIALASSENALLAGRALQGLAAAFAVPCTLAAVGTSAAPQRRATSIGAWSGRPDARVQYRPTARWPAHPYGGLARDILAEHATDVRRDRRPSGRPRGTRASRRCAAPNHRLVGLHPTGHGHGIDDLGTPGSAAGCVGAADRHRLLLRWPPRHSLCC